MYGKNGHAEVLGLVGQTHGKAIVIETPAEAAHLDFTKDIRLYSQTTKDVYKRQIRHSLKKNVVILYNRENILIIISGSVTTLDVYKRQSYLKPEILCLL